MSDGARAVTLVRLAGERCGWRLTGLLPECTKATSAEERERRRIESGVAKAVVEAQAVAVKLLGQYGAATRKLRAERREQLELMLVHFPATWGGKGGKEMRQATWRAMEAFVKAGKAKAIGISHYCKSHVENILEISTIMSRRSTRCSTTSAWARSTLRATVTTPPTTRTT